MTILTVSVEFIAHLPSRSCFTGPRDPCKVKQVSDFAEVRAKDRELDEEALGLEGDGASRKNPHELNTQTNTGTWRLIQSLAERIISPSNKM